jgi:hypothetical protein
MRLFYLNSARLSSIALHLIGANRRVILMMPHCLARAHADTAGFQDFTFVPSTMIGGHLERHDAGGLIHNSRMCELCEQSETLRHSL